MSLFKKRPSVFAKISSLILSFSCWSSSLSEFAIICNRKTFCLKSSQAALKCDIDSITEQISPKTIDKFIAYIRLSYFSVLNNINIYEKKDISVVIKDKHKLLGFDISKDHFAEANFDEFVKQVQIIDYYNNIEKSNILLEDIQFMINARSVLKK